MIGNLLKSISRNGRLLGIASTTLVAGFSAGLVVGYSSPAIPKMMSPSSPIVLSEEDASWFSSLIALGAIFGGLVAGYLSDKIGRKGTILFTGVPMVIGWLLISYAPTTLVLFIGRTLTGLCCGIMCVAIPTYLVEIATPTTRGFLGVSFQTLYGTGVLMVAVTGTAVTWNWLAIICVIPIVFSMMTIFFVPETPLWLKSHNKHESARAAAEKLYGKQSPMLDAFTSTAKLPNDSTEAEKNQKLTLSGLASRAILIPAIYSMLLMAFQQFTGISPVTFNSVTIFQRADPSQDGHVVAIRMILMGQVGLIVGSLLVDKLGRKSLLCASGFGMAIGQIWCGCYFYFVETIGESFQRSYGWMAFGSISLYVFFYSIGFGPIPWMLIPEMIPQRARGLVTGVSTTLVWALAFVISKCFDQMNRSIRPYGTFWLYGGSAVLAAIFCACFLPETKGKTLEEIEKHFSNERGENNSRPNCEKGALDNRKTSQEVDETSVTRF